jgi:hypothetical protein
LRHCVVKSAFSNAAKTEEVEGIVVCIIVVLIMNEWRGRSDR